MGEVWRGRDSRFDRPVAIKVLRSEYADDPSFAARFRAEATHAAALSHPNIAAVHDYGETTSRATGERIAYLVMELVDGEPLSARLHDGGPMGTQSALSVLRQAAAALAEAHQAGVVHRDVKPANILVRRDGTVKLTDFGIAWSAASVPLTRTGQVIGTPQYMSPEQASGEAPRPASDVYALGLVGYESLTGHAAFDGDNPVTIALKQVQQDPDPLPVELPDEVRELIDAALAKDPENRIPDGSAFLDAIDRTLDGRTPVDPPPTRAISVPPAPRPRPADRRTPRRTWLVLAALVAVLLGAGTVGAVLGLPDDGSAPSGSADAATPEPGGIVLTAADHVGRPADQVAAELTNLGLAVQRLDRTTTAHPPGAVAALDPVGAPLSPGDAVTLHVAVAPPDRSAPTGAGAGADDVTAPGGAAPEAPDDPAGGTAADEGLPGNAPEPPAAPSGSDPAPSDPAPSDPPPSDPPPSEPAPSEPAPSEPAPSEPAPSEPAPSEPATPSGSEPTPSSTAPTGGPDGTTTPGDGSAPSTATGGPA
ncbi:serine/threonine protein kinase [Blastococcus sp. TF02A-30]|nr:serine/threonine protein kinase [Blastococcus sp. TF02A-30]